MDSERNPMYQCRGCGADLKFDIKSGNLKCDQCGSEFDPYLAKQTNEALETTDAFDATVFKCPQCGGEIMTLDNTAAGFCSFCGTHTTLESRITKLAKPLHVIPFKLTKEDCKDAYLKTARRAVYSPKELKNREHIESFRGIYMPYWLYDVKQAGEFEINAKTMHRRGNYDITKHYKLRGAIDNEFDGIPFDSSASFADNISERIVPYEEREMKPFSTAYLCGFYSDAADVTAALYTQDAVNMATEETTKMIKTAPEFAPYTITDTNAALASKFNTQCPPAQAALFPVWFMSYRNGDRVAYAAVNGQTGRVSADLPVSPAKFLIGSILVSVPVFLLLALLFTFTPRQLLIATAVLAVISMIVYGTSQSAIDKRENFLDDKGAMHKYDKNSKMVKTPKFSWLSFLSVIVCVVVIYLDPASDIIGYGAGIAAAVCEFITLLGVLKRYNKTATRPLPQFRLKGGDDRA